VVAVKKPLRAPPYPSLLAALVQEGERERLAAVLAHPEVGPTAGGRYRHWDALRHLEPPAGLSHEEWWVGIKLARRQLAAEVPLRDTGGRPFTVALPPPVLQLLQLIDRDASGRIEISEQVTNPDTRRSYLVSSLIEEAIRSSQLEGASTSRRVAKLMLRSGRPPRTKSERMIVNNYHAMNFVRDQADAPLTPSMVIDLHHVVTEGTLSDPAAAGRLQPAGDERVRVLDEVGEVLHEPPPASELAARLEMLCEFANSDDEGDRFLHPVVRSVIVHFWLAYDHPFEDGNGRTARALFYWSMLRRGYWLTEFLSISGILAAAPAKYARAFLYTEWDDNDLTYFLLHQLGVVRRAIASLQDYLGRKMAEVRESELLLRRVDLNHRQAALIGHALRRPGASYTIKAHANAHQVVYQSARTDLLDLAERGYLEKVRRGRAFHFFAPPDLTERLRV
jgi:Fic family protein